MSLGYIIKFSNKLSGLPDLRNENKTTLLPPGGLTDFFSLKKEQYYVTFSLYFYQNMAYIRSDLKNFFWSLVKK